MQWLTDNYSLLIVAVVVIVYLVLMGKSSLKNWLLYAVSEAEARLGEGTGKLKLVQVYTAFVTAYPIFSKILPFAVFSCMVDQVLVKMREMIENNDYIAAAICDNIFEEEKD